LKISPKSSRPRTIAFCYDLTISLHFNDKHITTE
jgi:hypothetical protein